MKPFITLFSILCLAVLIAWFVFSQSNSNDTLQQAYDAFIHGETTQSLAKREADFNRALTLYAQIEEEYSPQFGDGKLQYNIGNSYFHLGEYPLALLYYMRSIQLMPQDPKVHHNLDLTRKKLNLPPYEQSISAYQRYFLLSTSLSLPRRIQIFFFFSVATLLFSSLYIWSRSNTFKSLIAIFGLATAVVLANLIATHYFTPINALLIQPTALWRDAGRQYAQVLDTPLHAGQTVEVIDIAQEGAWLKIKTADGTLGYVPDTSIRII